mgnify:CR=1 FL=1
MNHTEAKRKAKRMSNDALEYTIKDCRAAIRAIPDADVSLYCSEELFARRTGEAKTT